MDTEDIPGLAPLCFLGLRTEIKGNIQYLSDEEVLYPVGGTLSIHNYNQQRQKYIKLPERGTTINLICVSPNKKVIAVAEKGDFTLNNPPSIAIYDVASLKKRKQITLPPEKTTTSNCFEVMAFTFDSRLLLACLGDPDWHLCCFRWDRGKMENVTRANNYNLTGTIKCIAANPNDAGMIAVCGDVVFRLMAVTENVWRQFGYSKSESLNFNCCAWLSQDKLLTGTTDGRILFIDSGDLKGVFNAEELMYLNLSGKDDPNQQSISSVGSAQSTTTLSKDKDLEIRELKSFSRGFMFSYNSGVIHLFEKEGNNKYKKRNVFKIDRDILLEDQKPELIPTNVVNTIALSPMEDTIIVTTRVPQLYSTILWGPDMTRLPEIHLEEHGLSLHRGPVIALAVCRWKSTVMTAGRDDRTIRIWNYENNSQILYKEYQEDIYGLDLHPTGLYAIVGYASKLRYLTILIDDLAVTRELPIRYCEECKFSWEGHLFAAVNGNVIMIFSSISFENIVNLKGHNGRVSCMVWTLQDYRMVSCGTEGAVYEWNIADGKRLTEVIIKTCKFSGCAVSSDAKVIYAVGSDGELKEIMNGIVRTSKMIDKNGVNSVVLSKSNMMLFVSGRDGTIYSVKIPIKEQSGHLEIVMHSAGVNQMLISFDDKYLLTCANDSTLAFWKLVNNMGKTVRMDKDFRISEDILIPYNDLSDKITMIRDLTMRLNELDTEHSYQMRQIEAQHNMKIKDIHEAYCIAIEELKDKNTQLIAEHSQEFNALSMEMTNQKRDHDIAMQNLEATYNEKLITEYSKLLALEDKLANVRKEYDEKIEVLIEARKQAEAALHERYAEELRDKDIIIEELKQDTEQRVKEHEIIKQQIEDDADREIYELKTAHENELKEELETNIKIRAENGIYRKKVTAFQKETDELKHTIFTLEGEHVKFQAVVADLEKTIGELRREIAERDSTLQDKEKRIHELKRKNQELEKYKYVLEYEIENLKSQIEPRERKIHNQKEQIDDMVNELENLQKVIESLELQLTELREKLNASHCEYKREVSKFKQAQDMLKQMRIDLHNVSGLIQEPNKLKIAIKDMYHKYNADKDFAIIQVEDCDVENEFQKQRAYLEKTIAGLKQLLVKKRDTSEDERFKVMAESAELIAETNILRQELKHAQKQNKKMASVLGISNKYMLPKEAQKKLQDATDSKKTIHMMYFEKIQNYEKMIHSLKEENKRLLLKMNPKKSKSIQCIRDEEK